MLMVPIKPMAKYLFDRIKTPCIGVCSTGIGDSVCRGCKRYAHEVIHWNSYSQAQKRIIDERLTHFMEQVVATKLSVQDSGLLRGHLEAQQIVFSVTKSPFIWAYELLRAGASQIIDVEKYGLCLDAQYRHVALSDIRRLIDEEFYILSQAHYERYFELKGAVELSTCK